MSENIKIKKWICTGEITGEPADTNEVLEQAGRLLDRAYANEIVGQCLFEGEDGKIYVACTEVLIVEAHPDYAKQVLAEVEDLD